MKTDPKHDAFPTYGGQQGLTKREYFAAMALQALLTRDHTTAAEEHAVGWADMLIFALNDKRTFEEKHPHLFGKK